MMGKLEKIKEMLREADSFEVDSKYKEGEVSAFIDGMEFGLTQTIAVLEDKKIYQYDIPRKSAGTKPLGEIQLNLQVCLADLDALDEEIMNTDAVSQEKELRKLDIHRKGVLSAITRESAKGILALLNKAEE